jgi:hypothetical protein
VSLGRVVSIKPAARCRGCGMPFVVVRRETALTRDATPTTQMYASVRRRKPPTTYAVVDGRALLPSAASAALRALTFSKRLQKSHSRKMEKRGEGVRECAEASSCAQKRAFAQHHTTRHINVECVQ